jgi:cytochrome P450
MPMHSNSGKKTIFKPHSCSCSRLTMNSFVQACVKEALRIFGPVPMGLPRIAPKGGLTIGDRTIPEGTIVSINRESMNLESFVLELN